MPYWELFYHVVWCTRNREPLLVAEVEPAIYGYLRAKAHELGATVYALNGTDDHVHMVVAVPPRIAVATFVGQVKALASNRFNKTGPGNFGWQAEYGVFSFHRKQLRTVVAYVDKQKEHHAQGTTLAPMERVDDSGFSPHHGTGMRPGINAGATGTAVG